jgi:hypothetical protein
MSTTLPPTPYHVPQPGGPVPPTIPPQGKGPAEHDGFAIASLVTSFFMPILGIIFGHLSNHRAKLAHRAKSGLAIAGLVLGYLFTSIAVLVIAIVAAAASSTPSSTALTPPPSASAPATQAPAPATHAPAPARSTYDLPVGSTITIKNGDDNGSNWTVTVNSIRDYQPGQYDTAAPAGQHYIVANVTYKALTGQSGPNSLDWEAKAANGQTYQSQLGAGDSSTQLQANNVSAGQSSTGDVYLTVPNGSTGNTVVYSNGLSESGSWAVPSGV